MPPIALAALAVAAVHSGCPKTFTYHMDTRAASAVYARTRDVHAREVRMLSRIARCQRRPWNVPKARAFNAAKRSAWQKRRAPAPMQTALASWYGIDGTGACNVGSVQSGYRFASLILPCGAVAQMCMAGTCIEGTMSDHGPYVAGRTFDLNANMAQALGCGGVCEVRWRLM